MATDNEHLFGPPSLYGEAARHETHPYDDIPHSLRRSDGEALQEPQSIDDLANMPPVDAQNGVAWLMGPTVAKLGLMLKSVPGLHAHHSEPPITAYLPGETYDEHNMRLAKLPMAYQVKMLRGPWWRRTVISDGMGPAGRGNVARNAAITACAGVAALALWASSDGSSAKKASAPKLQSPVTSVSNQRHSQAPAAIHTAVCSPNQVLVHIKPGDEGRDNGYSYDVATTLKIEDHVLVSASDIQKLNPTVFPSEKAARFGKICITVRK